MSVVYDTVIGLRNRWRRLPVSERCRLAIVAITAPTALVLGLSMWATALDLPVTPSSRPDGFAPLAAEWWSHAAYGPISNGRHGPTGPAVNRAETIVEVPAVHSVEPAIQPRPGLG